MFALSNRGLCSLRWPLPRPQGRRSPVACRPFLETLEDRNLLSSTLAPSLTPSALAVSSANASQTAGGPQAPTPSNATTNVLASGSLATTVGSPQQVILALNKQPAAMALAQGPLAFPFMNQPSFSTTPGQTVQGSFSPSAPLAFLGYPALQDPAVNFRTALGYGPYTQSTPPGLFLVGGAAGTIPDNQPNRPAQPPPPPPPPPPARISTPAPIEDETATPLSGEEDAKDSNQTRTEETLTPARTAIDPESATGIDNLTLLALANAPRLDESALNSDTEFLDLALAEFVPSD